VHLILPIHILPCSNSAVKGSNGTNRIPWYCCSNHHRTSPSPMSCFTVGTRCSPNVNSWCRENHEGWLIWPYYAFTVVWCPCFMAVAPSFMHLSITLNNHQRFSKSSPTIVKLTLDSFCRNHLQNSRMFNSAVTCAAVVLRYPLSDSDKSPIFWFFYTDCQHNH
jgi:hypothetical protein